MGFMGSIPIAGAIWQHIHYVVGLQRLGHDVYYIEDSTRLPYNPEAFEVSTEFEYAARILNRLSKEFGFQSRWAFCARYLPNSPTAGLPLRKIRQLYRDADAILNICGTQEFNDDLLVSNRILYIQSDPGFEQIKIDKSVRSTVEYVRRHRALFTFGENVVTKNFPVPLHGFKWLPTRQPVVTDFWKTSRVPSRTAVFTTIANWYTSGLKDITWRGSKYLFSKSREFLRFINAPKESGETFELASDIENDNTRRRFARSGWRLRCPFRMSVHYWLYRNYIQRSKGEFTVAKDQYVRLKTGWFSDRSACYLASGRPVIVQETGFTKTYGGEAGLISFRSLDEIVDAVEAINGDYARHSRAARILAREVFEAESVVSSILDRAGI
ncbi:MAG: hypothetical protein C5B58_02385 [Acidobacteria bacterium]|nr:MAG: hypothetical protein C5B58_02385 [Acidobacteriota bacterium]